MKKIAIIILALLIYCVPVFAEDETVVLGYIYFQNGIAIHLSTGQESSDASYSSSDYFSVNIEDPIYLTGLDEQFRTVIFLYDSNKNYIGRSSESYKGSFIVRASSFGNSLTGIPPENGAFIRVRTNNPNVTQPVRVEKLVIENLQFFELMSVIFTQTFAWISSSFEFVYRNSVLLLILCLAIAVIIFRIVRRWLPGI